MRNWTPLLLFNMFAVRRVQSKAFMRNWICANNAANYTLRGRAYNPASGSLGSTANAAMMSLMYADVIGASDPGTAQVRQLIGLSSKRHDCVPQQCMIFSKRHDCVLSD